MATSTTAVPVEIELEGQDASLRMGLRPTARFVDEDVAPAGGCFSFLSPRRTPLAVGPGSSHWVQGDQVKECPICEVEFGTQHKHVTRRHCRKCGGVFCYTCTYDKAVLRTWPEGMCLPFASAKTSVHVCSNCYDRCPPPADGLRRCRFCHQRVRVSYFDAHHSVCIEEQYARAQFAPKQLEHFGVARARSAAEATSDARAATTPSSSSVGTSDISSCEPSSSSAASGKSIDASSTGSIGSAASAGSEETLEVRDDEDEPIATSTPKRRHPFAVAQAATDERLSRLPEELQCSICMYQESNAAVVPCGHTVACVRCLERCNACPVCRKPIESILRLYRS